MPTLEWIGKSKVINHHQEVPFRVLERQYSYDEQGQHEEDNGSENMIIRGDNLEALKALLPRYEGRVKVAKLDVDQAPSVAQRLGIMSVPTLVAFREGKETARRTGVQSSEGLAALVGQEPT